MKTGGRETDQSIARHDRPPIDDALAVDNADDEAGEVVFAVGVEARHLRGLTAQKRAAVLTAPTRDARDHLLDHQRRQPSGRQVIEEEQRLGPLHEDVVDAVIHEVAAD